MLLALGALLVAAIVTGCGGSPQRPALGNDSVQSIDAATQSGDFHTPLDSTPDPDATTVYFTATGPNGPGVFRVPAGGGAATELVAGQPFVAPVGIAIDGAGRQLYVADPQAEGATGRDGQIFVVPVGGGAPAPLRGTEGTAPRGMDVVREGDQDMVYFTGKDPNDGQAGVFKLPAAGGDTPTVVAKGAPLVEPDGVTVSRAGVVYVTDRSAAGAGFGSVFKIEGTTVTKIVDRVRTGDPAGIALTLDETVLLVSALQPDRDSDQVLLVDVNSLQTGSVTKVVEQNKTAGGVHRARNRNVFSWAGVTAGREGAGIVYVVR
jgi:sugar lactone lactonase YvrE